MIGPQPDHVCVPYDDEELVVGSVAVRLSKSCDPAQAVTIFVEGSLRYRVIGIDPTETVGIPVYSGDRLVLSKAEAYRFRAIRREAPDGRLYITYYR